MPSIRIAHVSDTHLGFRALNRQDPATGRNQRTVDFEVAFERVIDSILDQRADAVIHSGDVFHHTRPTWQTMRHFIQQMRRLEDARIPTLVIAGNHDTPRIRTGGSAYSVIELALPSIRFVADYEAVHESDLFADLNLHVHAIPHGALTNDDLPVPQSTPGKRNVLVTHGMAPNVPDADKMKEAGELELSPALLDVTFDYIALGHYHMTMSPAPHAWYAGPTERTSWNDRDATPGYCMVTLGDPGTAFTIEHVPIAVRPMVDVSPVYADGRQGRDIADEVLEHLATVNDPTAMARVWVRNADGGERREAESILRREADAYVWNLQVVSDRKVVEDSTAIVAEPDDLPNMRELFREFIDKRRRESPTTYTETFATEFLTRGDHALEHAMQSADDVVPEGDVLA